MRKIFIIAEAGCNHNGNRQIALKLIKKAKDCGADSIKFQTFLAEDLVRKNMKKAAHLKNIKKEDSVFDMMRNLEFTKEDYLCLKQYARKTGIILFSSVFDTQSLKMISRLDLPILKIPSGEIINLELLDAVSRCGRPIILSTGMSCMEEIERAVSLILKNLRLKRKINTRLLRSYPVFEKGLVLMHTVSTYPAPQEELNLRAISTLKGAFGLAVGYSDHSPADVASLAAVSLGAELIEKHFTLSKFMAGPDHRASIEPKELKKLVDKIQDTLVMLGDGVKRPSKSEENMISLFRRAVIAKGDIKKGQVLKRDMLEIKRPLDGLGCDRLSEIVGATAIKDIKAGEPIKQKQILRK